MLRQKDGHIPKGVSPCGEFLKHFANYGSPSIVNDDSFGSGVVEIPRRREAGKFATPYFLAQSSPCIFSEGIHEVFALPKRDSEHKLSLWRGLKPELWKLEELDFTGVHEIYKFPTIHAVARKAIRVPTQNAARLSFFNSINHAVKYRSTGDLGGLFLDKLL
ncbi:hypothetical protein A2Z00_02975 [Candidatus Gottesmanbacteria bacterium RBG_13_45_10]|uniref:Uncharacterized protein n=1 Tax=Candidatus Gottesmanbacteria bacterium RBG_13_45_10 TaxID=1798370 RepID=A0A1F5ZI17_9BACT|nr:MAG: hypothetical protein A2Z00_02975 [Candidatus Gottesmanbacteria bacterium RBG_13_45_10]